MQKEVDDKDEQKEKEKKKEKRRWAMSKKVMRDRY